MKKADRLVATTLYADKASLLERLETLRGEMSLCGFHAEADLMMRPIAKLKSRRINKP